MTISGRVDVRFMVHISINSMANALAAVMLPTPQAYYDGCVSACQDKVYPVVK